MELEFDLGKKDEGTVEAAEEAANAEEANAGEPQEVPAEEAPPAEEAKKEEASPEAPAPEQDTEAVVEVPASKGVDISAAKEEVAGGPLMVAAYLAIWMVVFYFIFKVRKQTDELSSRVEEMEQKLDRGLEKASGATGSE